MEPLKEDQYLAERFNDQLNYYRNAASNSKKKFLLMQKTIIVIGILVPVIVNLPEDWFGKYEMVPIKMIVTVLSIILAITSGFLNFRKYGDLWLSFRATEELLKHEKFLYLTGSGKYQKSPSPYQLFVEQVENIISSEHNKFRSLIEDSKRPVSNEPN